MPALIAHFITITTTTTNTITTSRPGARWPACKLSAPCRGIENCLLNRREDITLALKLGLGCIPAGGEHRGDLVLEVGTRLHADCFAHDDLEEDVATTASADESQSTTPVNHSRQH